VMGTIIRILRKYHINITPQKGRNIFLFTIFTLVSFLFWLLLTLNIEVQKDFAVKINLNSIPDSTTIISNIPNTIRVSVRDKGSALLRYSLGQEPSIDIKFKDYIVRSGRFKISSIELRSLIRDAFGAGANIISITPDSIIANYTNLPGKKVPVTIDAVVQANFQYVISGDVIAKTDSVTIFSDKATLSNINNVYTYRIEEHELKDTLYRKVKIAPLKGAKIIPESIEVIIPVEPLITKHLLIPIVSRNVPANLNLVTFPSKVDASFLVPLSKYHKNVYFSANVFYDDVVKKDKKLKLNIIHVPNIYKNVSLAFDSVEYIIETK
ncbi:MAG: YbbR-like domain-containing protein, partial [Muribaculaceae bacterium]